MTHVRKGDEVVVVAGKDKGMRGRVLLVEPKQQRVKVEKVGMIKRHVKANQKHPQGGIVEQEGFIHLSNVRLWDPKARAACRTHVRVLENGRKVRVSTKSDETFE